MAEEFDADKELEEVKHKKELIKIHKNQLRLGDNMKKIFGNFVSDKYFEKFIADESNKNLVIVGDEIIGIQHILT